MSEQVYEVTLTAAGEVRDAEGNLISSPTGETTVHMTAQELGELGLEPPTTEGEPS